jgi:hypothetical protein
MFGAEGSPLGDFARLRGRGQVHPVDLDDEVLAATLTLVAPHLTERQRRLLFGAAARALGRVSRVARLVEASRPTVRRGAAELNQPADPRGRIRQHEGPKRLRERDPGLVEALDRLVEPVTRGDPQSPLRWTCKSTRELAEALTAQGHPVSDDTVGRLLKQQGYRLQRTVKTLEGAQHPDWDVCHLPPGTSKWNRIEHRLFSVISMNWRGRPLESHEVIVELIGAATTRTGLRVHAELDRGRYPLGVKVSDEELAAVPLARHTFHGEWNYSMQPAADKPPPTPR